MFVRLGGGGDVEIHPASSPTCNRAKNKKLLPWALNHLEAGDCEDLRIAGHTDTNCLSGFTASFFLKHLPCKAALLPALG